MKKWFPWIVALALGGWALGSLRLPADQQWAVRDFGRLPVMFGGRNHIADGDKVSNAQLLRP